MMPTVVAITLAVIDDQKRDGAAPWPRTSGGLWLVGNDAVALLARVHQVKVSPSSQLNFFVGGQELQFQLKLRGLRLDAGNLGFSLFHLLLLREPRLGWQDRKAGQHGNRKTDNKDHRQELP